jgi:cell division protein FtsB
MSSQANAQRILNTRLRKAAFAVLLISGLYLLCISPARAYLRQHEDVSIAQSQYETLVGANNDMAQQIEKLQSNDEVSRLARERYELVPRGYDAFAVMPPATTPTTAP